MNTDYQPTGKLQSVWTREDGRRMHTRLSVDSVRADHLPVWLIHGLAVSSRYMVPTARCLAPFRRVYAPDLPGFGHSAKPDTALNIPQLADALVRRMDAFGIRRAAMVGNSMGCQIIADLAVRYPMRLDRAVLIGPTMDRHGRTMLEQARRLLIDGLHEPVSSIITQGYDYCRFGPRRTFQTLRHALNDPIEAKLPYVYAPTMVLRGEHDPIAPQHWAQELASLLPNGQLVVLPGAPHATNYVAPAALVAAMLPFLA